MARLASADPPHGLGARGEVNASVEIAKLLQDYGWPGAFAGACAIIIYLYKAGNAASADSQARERALLERIIVIAEAFKSTTAASTEALKDNERAITALNNAIQTLAREAEGAAKDTRHGIGNLQGSVEAVIKFLERAFPRGARE